MEDRSSVMSLLRVTKRDRSRLATNSAWSIAITPTYTTTRDKITVMHAHMPLLCGSNDTSIYQTQLQSVCSFYCAIGKLNTFEHLVDRWFSKAQCCFIGPALQIGWRTCRRPNFSRVLLVLWFHKMSISMIALFWLHLIHQESSRWGICVLMIGSLYKHPITYCNINSYIRILGAKGFGSLTPP